MVDKKICPKCNIEKPCSDFYNRSNSPKIHSWCKQCSSQKSRETRRSRKILGVCRQCGHDRLKGSSVCLYHFVCSIFQKHDSLVLELINKLKEQNYTCLYSNTLLLPGINASIDHIVPRSKGGSNDISNLVWVDSSVNRMKANLDLEQFFTDYSSMIAEMKYLASIETPEQRNTRLNYVLGLN